MEMALMNIMIMIGVLCSVMVITAENGVHSVLYLVLVFLNMGGLLVLLEVDFMGLIIVMVYVGAVAVLFLFIVMMVGEIHDPAPRGVRIALLVMMTLVFMDRFGNNINMDNLSMIEVKDNLDRMYNMESLGEVLFTVELINVLLCGLVLLVGMIGGVILGKK